MHGNPFSVACELCTNTNNNSAYCGQRVPSKPLHAGSTKRTSLYKIGITLVDEGRSYFVWMLISYCLGTIHSGAVLSQ